MKDIKTVFLINKEMKKWVCAVCGYVHEGEGPPDECPQCSSPKPEFSLEKKKEKLVYDGKSFDVLLINGSSHRSHNTGFVCDLAEEELRKRKTSYRRFNLNEFDIQHCWCCYSIRDEACTFPCRNQLDDVPALHEMLLQSKAVIVCSPINWNQMSARLKDFLDRLTSIQNQCLVKKESLTAGKVLGVFVDGHEDGAAKTMLDIYFYFQEMGFILAPYGYGYRTHNAEHDTKDDKSFFRSELSQRFLHL